MKLFLALLLLLLPTLLYIGYVSVRRRSIGGGADWWESGPGFWLAIGGVGLMIGALITWGLTSGASPDSLYVPERFVDGELIEGHFLPPADPDTAPDEAVGADPADDAPVAEPR